ncbi:Peptidase M16 inactive domain protein [Bremerella volcania]|uniref:Peptidase M16 inactive domain protein n=1 Tax=Bremerella volcania TaxID=2527984 RepID=A0A518C900_9BACT|nr:pitrilysin family protein [Bremerella volcania]QDU75690.1 Peptidase M16 inactive domain protein [Bremerella volcania]
MRSTYYSESFNNGLTLLAESMPWLQSAAFSIVIPAGVQREEESNRGVANLLCDWVQRGCGDLDSRQYVEALDNLGVARGGGVSSSHLSFGGALLAENLEATLGIYADLVQRPHFLPDEFEDAKQVCFQELRALEDDLHQQAMLSLRRQMYPDPWGWHPTGTLASVESLTEEVARAYFDTWVRPNEAIIAVAGNFDWGRLKETIQKLFGNWKSRPGKKSYLGSTLPEYVHIPFDSSQTHVGLGFASVPISNPDFYQARAAIGIMSDGMSSRLFSEVREKRGLCYTVYASCNSLKTQGAVLSYAGTSTERAQETLDVMIEEFNELPKGVRQDELTRLKARFKSGIIMQQESSSSRASALAADWYHLGRIRTMEELETILDGISVDTINAYLEKNPPKNYRVTTIGAKRLEVPSEISSGDA